MRVYGNIYSAFWNHETMRGLPDDAKLLAVYLLTSHHGNLLGCFTLPLGYMAEDLNWTKERVTEALEILQREKFIHYDYKLSWMLICNYLKWNPIANPNQGRSLEKLFPQIPSSSAFYLDLIQSITSHSKYLSSGFLNRLETLSKPFLNQEQEQEQEQEKEQEQDIFMSGKPDAYSLENIYSESNSALSKTKLKEDAKEVLEFLNQKTNRNYRPVEANLKLIMARLASGATVAQCRKVIAKKTREWQSDAKMMEYLRPATLFNATKFEQYLGELLVMNSEDQLHEG